MAAYEESSPGVVALLLDDIAPPRLGSLLRAARKQRKMTRREVASRVGTTPTALKRYERGDEPVPPHVVAELAECYGEDLAAQFATRAPVQVDPHTIAVGDESRSIATGDTGEVLGTYVAIVARLRRSQPGTPIALRADDVVALSSALGMPAEQVEQRIVEMLGCTAHEAHSLHAEMLRRKLVVPVAGLVAGLAVVTGVAASGVMDRSPNATGPGGSNAQQVVRIVDVTPTASEIAATAATLPVDTEPATPAETPATIPVVATTPTPAPAPVPEPVATPEPAAAAPEVQAAPEVEEQAEPEIAEPAANPTPAPVIAPDDTPMGVPPNETYTIIQP